ncbi:Peptidoglycan/xylan/chitin deacetylase, PgdA/CDA1 family [Alkalithermobacter thermoalcaliphilus JW-YL-7 = DSM 7308]|uniref:Peptidoglycan/xylan/chitin deacetylase, PgdA/CDA1 family n=1 Tax=Alkalithermobacter thermoalcaliphilus JW-YL-7 = DSM 7308 TaxID=1121328 RepID=A0A150FS51_CLOPD|nr:polysaccharide deacetylase [[Clostridium] paradoxum JW-YL-7 = DSM 7308]SHK33116.1 Peptidoglycan/xylan/chitin deacetylase, PgdA/CDA1 family [[Clostridium] paradoxum JW-YL-7 = DSM 7308]
MKVIKALAIIFLLLVTGACQDHKIDNKQIKEIEENIENDVVESPKSLIVDQEKLDKIYKKDGQKIAYLTFDDGPSKNITPKILDILKENEIKATFFVVGENAQKNSGIIKRMYEEGHNVGNHTYSHNFRDIYKNSQNFIDSVKKCDEIIKSILGETYDFNVVRFPGGSSGKDLKDFKIELNNAGYSYVDWNCLNGDSEKENKTVDELFERFIETSKGREKLVILMHDNSSKINTPESLEKIIKYLKENGYIFKLFSQIDY